jgi:transcriptional antiterminator NusG
MLGLSLNAALLIVVRCALGALWLLYRWHRTPKIADLLIETEAELRKVTWPTMPEAINSSIVVIVCVLFLMVYLAAQTGCSAVVDRILTGRAADSHEVVLRPLPIRSRRQHREERADAPQESRGVQDLVPQVLVPFERVTDLKNGKKRIVNRKLYPGYLMVQADSTIRKSRARSRRATRCARSMVCASSSAAAAKRRRSPKPRSRASCCACPTRSRDRKCTIGLHKGDMVKIKSGAFDGFDGSRRRCQPREGARCKVVVTIFGRPTPVELEYWEVEAV